MGTISSFFILFSTFLFCFAAAAPLNLHFANGSFDHLVPENYSHGAAEFLLDSILEDDIESVRNYIEAGLDVNSRDSSGNLYLNYAVTFGNLATISLLLSSGANPTLSDSSGHTALHRAVLTTSPDMEIIELLFQYSADIYGSVNVNGVLFTFLDYAVINGAIEIFETYRHRIFFDAENDPYFLDLALKHSNNINVIFYLLSLGSDPNYTTRESKTSVLIYLIKNRCKVSDLKKLLFSTYSVTNIDSVDSDGLSALSHAVIMNNPHIILFLFTEVHARVNPRYVPRLESFDRDTFIQELNEYEAGYSAFSSPASFENKKQNLLFIFFKNFIIDFKAAIHINFY